MDLQLEIIGKAPLLMRNVRLGDPTNDITRAYKEISGKHRKTDADVEEMAHLEYLGGIYYSEEAGVYVPGDNIQAAIAKAAGKRRMTAEVKSGIFITPENKLIYEGPRTPEDLWLSKKFMSQTMVKVQGRVLRTRPKFPVWAVTAGIILDTEILSLENLRQFIEVAGSIIGLGDWRPRFGRFEAALTVLNDGEES